MSHMHSKPLKRILTMFVFNLAALASASAQSHYQVIHGFHNNPANQPLATPILDASGNVYGTTQLGGPVTSTCGWGCGTVYELSPAGTSWSSRLLYQFHGGNDGSLPTGKLLPDSSGDFFGVTNHGGGSTLQFCTASLDKGCGTAYELSPASGGGFTEKVIYAFTQKSHGYLPSGGLVSDAAGNLFGVASAGGSSTCGNTGCGVVYQLAPNSDGTWTQSVLHVFNGGSDGCFPTGELVFDAAGQNLYGTAGCGSNPSGVVFQMSPASGGGWNETIVYNFRGGSDGSNPAAGLVFDTNGNLFGTTVTGGLGEGTVFELTQTSGIWTETLLHSFLGGKKDGAAPYGAVAFDAAGNLYGTTAQGGTGICTSSCGIVYKLSAGNNWAETAIHAFTGGKDGGIPEAGLTFDSNGNAYGAATFGGGSGSYGVVFRITP